MNGCPTLGGVRHPRSAGGWWRSNIVHTGIYSRAIYLRECAVIHMWTGVIHSPRLATISDIVGRQVASSNELSYSEAARVLEKLT